VVVEIDKSETHMTADIRFLLNGVERRVDAPSPTLTVLEYLRLTERATGTKEGCAEGD
jgi:xanthine dehydrogenase small subunit